MSPPESTTPDPSSQAPALGATGIRASFGRGTLIAVVVGVLLGGVLVYGSVRDGLFAGRSNLQIGIRINGLDERVGRDVLVPLTGWVLQVDLPEDLPQSILDTLEITLREERTGAMLDITKRLIFEGPNGRLVLPESLRLTEGLFSVRVGLVDTDGAELVEHRRIRIRSWLGGPPIGSRQIIHFDFSVDRDGDGQPDFEQDLAYFGLASADRPELASAVAKRVAERAVARVLRAYDPKDDPNGTGYTIDTVFVRFLLETERTPFVTRICVGGANVAFPDSVGNVRFDPRNETKGSSECEARDDAPPAGLFPREFSIYAESALYQEVLGPFDAKRGGTPFGALSSDVASLAGEDERARALTRAIDVFGDALGTIMAHESAHALGLVPPGRPGVGLFGGEEKDGAEYAHNLDTLGNTPQTPWLMNVGGEFRFEDLAGQGPGGELRFRPLNHAYLKDRVALAEGRY